MTDLKKIKSVIDTLGSIQVPVELAGSITIPIYNSLVALNSIYMGMKERESNVEQVAEANEVEDSVE